MTIAIGIALCILGVVLGVVLAQRLSPAPRGEHAEDARQHLLDAARTEAEPPVVTCRAPTTPSLRP